MKRLLHILLISFYLFSTTELQELAKLPVLFQHYFEHKGIDQNMTFMAYLEHHYSDIPHTDNDQDRDNQLPFKTNGIFAAGSFSAALLPLYQLTFRKSLQVLPKQKIRLNNDYIPSSAFAGKIWQPPKYLILS